MLHSDIKKTQSYNDLTNKLLDIPIRDDEEYKQWEEWLKKWSKPKNGTPKEIINKALEQMNAFRSGKL